MIRVWFDFPEEPQRASVERMTHVVPRIGESVGVVPVEGVADTYELNRVGTIRHYYPPGRGVEPEIRILLESR